MVEHDAGTVTRAEVHALATAHGIELTDDDAEVLRHLVTGALGAADALVEGASGLPPVPADRRWWRPGDGEDEHAAWVVRCELTGAPDGPLAGVRAAVKDTVQVAGLPLTNGTAMLDGYVAEVDATVTSRLLAAGATLVGTTRCEQFCMSDGSHTGAGGPVHNPYRRGHTAGGSSSGSAVVVATGQVDLAIGGDQGGSIRVPSAYCGTVGMKPTWGLVPYTGISRMEPHLDHAGPMTATVVDNARALSALAGPDGIDPSSPRPVQDPGALLDRGVDGLRVGVLDEGFTHPRTQPEVARSVRATAEQLAAAGADVVDVSVPAHAEALQLCLPIMTQGLYRTVLADGGQGVGRPDVYLPELHRRMATWRVHAGELSAAMVVSVLAAAAVERRHGALPYQLAVNHARRTRAAYDAALAEVDVLLLPTTPTTAPPLPSPDAPLLEQVLASTTSVVNTFPFDVTHHPALSVPCGTVDGLPVGAMLVGRHLDEATVYAAGAVVEATAG